MATTPVPSHITLYEFAQVLSRYPATMSALSETNSAPKLAKPDESSELSSEELDLWRLNTLPEVVKARSKPCLMKEELQKLLGCKMARGKRRQALPKLISSNDPSTVTAATTAAFDHLLGVPSPPTTAHIIASLKELTDPLKGVGPATASYILAIMAPDTVPPFSDEAYRWILHSPGREGWGKKIKYDAKEYRTYVEGVKALVERLGGDVTAGEVEKVGFVLGKEGAEFRSTPGPAGATGLSGVDALDAALGLEGGQKTTTPTIPAAPAAPVTESTVTGSTVTGKRKADENRDSEDDAEPSEPRPVQRRRAPAPKRERGR
ncbi:uncharacterized protein LAJ45_00086 [Morchella importuna]|uniref:uncharacterized protein n=1 Tax=Morchella importuna TaxID=1174673 RepID=UPI001E8DB4C3|nr:uncharacterized protein LAJ45_00086 [Morchella importuna]KAH8155077.1 hypothetical protein LAJ45_00086 [Morchella importuna]